MRACHEIRQLRREAGVKRSRHKVRPVASILDFVRPQDPTRCSPFTFAQDLFLGNRVLILEGKESLSRVVASRPSSLAAHAWCAAVRSRDAACLREVHAKWRCMSTVLSGRSSQASGPVKQTKSP